MNKIMLINRINPQDYTGEKKKMFFLIGGMNLPSIENKLIDILNNLNMVESNDVVLKYNGIELNISIQQIPMIINTLCKEGILVYSVYQLYNPDL